MAISEVVASSSQNLDQTSYTQVPGMTLTPAAGDYLAVFTMDVQNAADTITSSKLSIAIYVNGVQDAASVRSHQQNSSLGLMSTPIVTSAKVSPAGSQVVEVKYITDDATTPMAGTKRQLTLYAADTIIEVKDAVTDTIATDVWTTLDTMTNTPAAGTYLLVFSAHGETQTAEVLGFRVSVDGSPLPHTERRFMEESSAAGKPVYNDCLQGCRRW